MSSASTPQPEPTPPRTLPEFQQQFAAAVLANMKASNDAQMAALRQQQERMEAATAELIRQFGSPTLKPTGATGQPPEGETPAAPAGPT